MAGFPDIVMFAGAPKSGNTNRGYNMKKSSKRTAAQSRFARIAKACAVSARKGGQPYVKCMTKNLKK